jgi:integrase
MPAHGFPGVRLHDIRAGHATALLDAGVPIHVVAALCGHDPATLLRWYAKRSKKSDTRAAEAVFLEAFSGRKAKLGTESNERRGKPQRSAA